MAKQQSKEIIPLLDTIGESSTKMLDAMADIVWTINPENDQFEKILLRMRNFAYALLGAKNIDYEFDANEEIHNLKLSMEVRRNLYLIFKEATNNLAKYSEASQAMFSITGNKDQLTMLIRDNGKGFDMEKQTEGNGLKNMRKRAVEIGAQLLIEAFPGKGTQIQLKMAV
jgi:signal transduction histidine kinase